MTLAHPERFLSPKETVEDIRHRYGLPISLTSFYSMISRREGPKPTYFRNRPKFTIADIDAWVSNNLSDNRK
jgi:hypothetical protein